MITEDLHVHTTFCDGHNTPREMVEAALQKGMKRIGFSGHSHTAIDESYCMAFGAEEYRREIARLKEEYRGKIDVLCGVEQDYYSDDTTEGYDFVIGSVHYIKAGETYIPVDDTAEKLSEGAALFNGDIYALVEAYYATVADVVNKTNCDIIGHFDLITKFSERTPLFDTSHPRCVAAWKKAADALLQTGRVFEINTGAISRGYRTSPYPSAEICRYLASRGAVFRLSGDSHRADTLCFDFDQWENFDFA